MIAKTFTLTGTNIQDTVCNFVRQYQQQAHESNYPGGFIRLYEDFSFLNGNDIVNCLRVDYSDIDHGRMIIEMISGGSSSTTFWPGNTRSENRRIKHFAEKLEAFCEEKNITLQA